MKRLSTKPVPVASPSVNPYADAHAKMLLDKLDSARTNHTWAALGGPKSPLARRFQQEIDHIERSLAELARPTSSPSSQRSGTKRKRVVKKKNRRFQRLSARRKPLAGNHERSKSGTRERVNSFISRVFEATGEKIKRKDISLVAGYKNRTDFERYQRGDVRVTKTAIVNFDRVLRMEPTSFVRRRNEKREKL